MTSNIDHYIATDSKLSEYLHKLNPKLWEYCEHNIIKYIELTTKKNTSESKSKIEVLYKSIQNELDINSELTLHSFQGKSIIAYFSPEIAIAQYLPSYSGGLGVLACDHIKTASDMKLPLIAVSILYRKGFFKQKLSKSGTQNSNQVEINTEEVGIFPIYNSNGEQESIIIRILDQDLKIFLYQIKIGNTFVILLDSNSESNKELQGITETLYDGDREIRLLQEIILGIGGIRALHKLQLIPEIIHINEGHAAFALLEDMRQTDAITINARIEITKAKSLFTTHTPVIHGNEEFDLELVRKYFNNSDFTKIIGIDDLIALGYETIESKKFSMTALALNLSNNINAVSKLHSTTANNMWNKILTAKKIKIKGITNGIHFNTWLSYEFRQIYDKYIDCDYLSNIEIIDYAKYLYKIPENELIQTKKQLKSKLINFLDNYFRLSPPEYIKRDRFEHIKDIIHEDCFLIGFARRFAPYKRADLLFNDIDRLKSILSKKDRPVRILISGKAHPADTEGKLLLKNIIKSINNNNLDTKVIFIENYDLRIAKHLVQSCDLWLNTPIRTLEASGTSGMKSALNGGVNFSILDGWWDEAYNQKNGWTIGDYNVNKLKDRELAKLIYDKLENEIIPLYFTGKSPTGDSWYDFMINSINTVLSNYSSHRMLNDYLSIFYNKMKKESK